MYWFMLCVSPVDSSKLQHSIKTVTAIPGTGSVHTTVHIATQEKTLLKLCSHSLIPLTCLLSSYFIIVLVHIKLTFTS